MQIRVAGLGEENPRLTLSEITPQWLDCVQSSLKEKIYHSWAHWEHKARNSNCWTLALDFHSQTKSPKPHTCVSNSQLEISIIPQNLQIQLIPFPSYSLCVLPSPSLLAVGQLLEIRVVESQLIEWLIRQIYWLRLLDMSGYVLNASYPITSSQSPSSFFPGILHSPLFHQSTLFF